jgi:hypothetical protein
MGFTGRYLKPGVGCTTPGVVISVAVNTTNRDLPRGSLYTEQVFKSAAIAISRKTRGKWSKPRVVTVNSYKQLHSCVLAMAELRKRNYIICPCASNVLTLTHWWEYAEEHGILFTPKGVDMASIDDNPDTASMLFVSRLCLRGKPDILSYRHFGKSFMWLSSLNYFDASKEVLSESLNYLIPTKYRGYRDNGDARERLIYECLLYQTAFCGLVDWWRMNAKAPFGLTVGQLSIGILRSYLVPKSLSTHSDATAHKLERIASYGGRASLWFVGSVGNGVPIAGKQSGISLSTDISNVPGPITHLDIRSMYPTLLRDSAFPCKYHKRHGPVSPLQLSDLQRYYGTIAHVRARIHNAEYPMRTDRDVIYPRGVFQTVLAGPDLEALTGKDQILEVYDCVTYILGEPFKRAAGFLLETRIRARKSGDFAWELFAKTLGASLGGKLAQTSGKWVDCRSMVAERQWGEWYDYNADTSSSRKFRSIAGMVSEYIRDETGKGPFTACFAYLTAYGRQLMRKIREAFDTETVVSQDTDGLWVLGDIPCGKLANIVSFGNNPGQVQIKEVSNNGYFLGPKHYYTDSGWVLSGFHNPIVRANRSEIEDTYYQNPILTGTRTLPVSIRKVQRTSAIGRLHNTSGASPYGWIRPLYIDHLE